MNNLLISYGDYDHNGRLRELNKIFSEFGTLNFFSRGSKAISKVHMVYSHDDTYKNYFDFIVKCIKFGKTVGNIDILFLDNRKAIIPGYILSIIKRPKLIVLDCRELYILKEVKHITGKIGCLIESLFLKEFDVLIAANSERANIMQKIYNLKEKPLVYENIRALEYSEDVDLEQLRKKYSNIIKNDEFRIISSSGCNVFRTSDLLVENLKYVKGNCRLILAGWSKKEDERVIQEIIEKNKYCNVEILGQINQNELKYLIDNSHIGIVNYNQKDTNNMYCASGKLYEFIYEKIPVVTTSNPPLKRICEEKKIGVVDDCYFQGINRVCASYDFFKENAEELAKAYTVEINNAKFIDELKHRIDINMKDRMERNEKRCF